MQRSRFAVALATLALTLSACAWIGDGGDAGRTNYNPFGGFASSTIGRLQEVWRTAGSSVSITTLDGEYAIAAIEQTRIASGRLEAYSASGSGVCSGTPRTCGPTWIAELANPPFDAGFGLSVGAPVLVGDYVAVAFRHENDWRLSLYDRQGVRACSAGPPRVCDALGSVDLFPVSSAVGPPLLAAGAGAIFAVRSTNAPVPSSDVVGIRVAGLVGCATDASCAPFMRASTGTVIVSAAYSDGRLYLRAPGNAIALDAAGIEGCAQGVCSALFTFDTTSTGYGFAVAHGRVVDSGQGIVQVFDAAGELGCAGVPRHCSPLWTAAGTASNTVFAHRPIVTPEVVVVVRATASGNEIAAYDLAPGLAYSGVPLVCGARWTLPLSQQPTALIAADNVGLVGGAPGGAVAPLVAFRLDGDGCNATTRVCPPIASIPMAIAGGPTAVAGGRLLITGVGTPTRVFAVPA